MPYFRPVISVLGIVLLIEVVMVLHVSGFKPPSFNEAAQAQQGEQQYLAPSQTGDGTYVFTGTAGNPETVTTELFEITSNQFTVTSESEPPDFEPFVNIVNENGEALNTEFDSPQGSTVDTVENVDPGLYQLENTSVEYATYTYLPRERLEVDATYTVTVSEQDTGEAGGTQYEDAGVTPTQPEQTESTPVTESAPQPIEQDFSRPKRELMEAGGPVVGPVPVMSSGGCPEEYPLKRENNCYSE